MRLLVVAFLLVAVTLAGCSNVRTYTFTKERVDQTPKGNRGYIMGTPPPVTTDGPVKRRTLIGVDIEIPLLPGEEGYEPTGGGVIYAEDVMMTPKSKKSNKDNIVIVEEDIVVQEERTNFAPKAREESVEVVEDDSKWAK